MRSTMETNNRGNHEVHEKCRQNQEIGLIVDSPRELREKENGPISVIGEEQKLEVKQDKFGIQSTTIETSETPVVIPAEKRCMCDEDIPRVFASFVHGVTCRVKHPLQQGDSRGKVISLQKSAGKLKKQRTTTQHRIDRFAINRGENVFSDTVSVLQNNHGRRIRFAIVVF